MRKLLVLTVYNILLPIFFIFAFPAWLMKMAKRGGIGSGLLERFGIFQEDELLEKQGCIYIHAVSVGEVLIAIKLIKEWLVLDPEVRILLVPTTATGHAVAKEHAPLGVRVIYSPLDFGLILKRVFKRFEPKQIILMESEIWPNLLHVAQKLCIPVNVVNARLSPRSEKRYLQLGFILRPLLEMLGKLCAQDEGDKARWEAVGVPTEKIFVTGSIKFDQSGAGKPQRRTEFSEMLEVLAGGKKIVMAISTHAGEELWIAKALLSIANEIFLVIVPRHAERRAEVLRDISSVGYDVVLRSQYQKKPGACFVIDSTGELRDWTAHADLAIIGKSILGKGGQNPTEAMSVSVPVITGIDMSNFEPLVTQLKDAGGIRTFTTQQELLDSVRDLLDEHSQATTKQTDAALKVLKTHQGATRKSVEVLFQ
jgi:3-deoxy-D-manno-octulosonic-acid transferase